MARTVERKSYKPSEFATAYGVSVGAVYDLIRSGRIEARLLDKTAKRPRYLIPAAEAEKWFDSLTAA